MKEHRMRMFNDSRVRKILGPKSDSGNKRTGGDCKMSFLICTAVKILLRCI
jgi:hypothetical protein